MDDNVMAISNIALCITYLSPADQNEAWIRDMVQVLGYGRLAQVAFVNTCAVLQFEVWYATPSAAELLIRLGGLHFARGGKGNTIQVSLPGTSKYWHLARYTGKFPIPSAYQLALLSPAYDREEVLRSFLVQQLYFRQALHHVEFTQASQSMDTDAVQLHDRLRQDEIQELNQTIVHLQSLLDQAHAELARGAGTPSGEGFTV